MYFEGNVQQNATTTNVNKTVSHLLYSNNLAFPYFHTAEQWTRDRKHNLLPSTKVKAA